MCVLWFCWFWGFYFRWSVSQLPQTLIIGLILEIRSFSKKQRIFRSKATTHRTIMFSFVYVRVEVSVLIFWVLILVDFDLLKFQTFTENVIFFILFVFCFLGPATFVCRFGTIYARSWTLHERMFSWPLQGKRMRSFRDCLICLRHSYSKNSREHEISFSVVIMMLSQ